MSRAFRLGIFIVATLLVLAAGVFLIGEKQFLFQRTYRLEAQFQDVAGLDNGADVRVGGIHLGTVKYISLPDGPSGKLTVVMDMANSTKNIVRQNSVATIKTEGLLGNKYVEVSFGSEKAPEIASGDTIKGETPVDFSDAALGVMNQAKTAATAFAEDADALKQNFLLRGFFNKRGYEDPNELKKNKIAQLPSEHSTKEFSYQAKDIFDKTDNAKLKNEKAFDEAGKFLEDNKFRLVVVAASAELGDTDKDRVLTQARAKVVRDYLVEHFKFDDKKVKTIGLGKSAKADATGKVEIRIYNSTSE
jgi:outer membrane protein OmpA-like peptidoglycan-associated protein